MRVISSLWFSKTRTMTRREALVGEDETLYCKRCITFCSKRMKGLHKYIDNL